MIVYCVLCSYFLPLALSAAEKSVRPEKSNFGWPKVATLVRYAQKTT